MKKITLLLMAVIMTMTMSAQQVQGKKLPSSTLSLFLKSTMPLRQLSRQPAKW